MQTFNSDAASYEILRDVGMAGTAPGMIAAGAALGRSLERPPSDGVSSLSFSSSSDLLVCSSWDGVGSAAPMSPQLVNVIGLRSACCDVAPALRVHAWSHGIVSPLMQSLRCLQSVRLYDGPRNVCRASFSQQAPVLDATFQDDSRIFLGGLDGIVKRYCVSSSHASVMPED